MQPSQNLDALLGRPRPGPLLDPPRNANGEIDYDAWEQRLSARGIRGLPDGELSRRIEAARDGDRDVDAELSLAERYADVGYHVELVLPWAEGGPIYELYSPDLRVVFPGMQPLRVDVKFREPGKLVLKSSVNARIDHANLQIKKSREGRGDIIADCSAAAPGAIDQAEIERYLKGKMSGNRSAPNARLGNIDYLEIIYPDYGQLKRSCMLRTPMGIINGPFSEVLP